MFIYTCIYLCMYKVEFCLLLWPLDLLSFDALLYFYDNKYVVILILLWFWRVKKSLVTPYLQQKLPQCHPLCHHGRLQMTARLSLSCLLWRQVGLVAYHGRRRLAGGHVCLVAIGGVTPVVHCGKLRVSAPPPGQVGRAPGQHHDERLALR